MRPDWKPDPKCKVCKGTGIDPMCFTDVLKGEEPCTPPHSCPICNGRRTSLAVRAVIE